MIPQTVARPVAQASAHLMALPGEIRMSIAGFETRDDQAFPGQRAAAVHLQGCPLACGYCETASRWGPRAGPLRGDG